MLVLAIIGEMSKSSQPKQLLALSSRKKQNRKRGRKTMVSIAVVLYEYTQLFDACFEKTDGNIDWLRR